MGKTNLQYTILDEVYNQKSAKRKSLTVSDQLSWSHYYELLKCTDAVAAGFR